MVHEPRALPPEACAALRGAVDAASFAAADSVDGCIDYQLNLSRGELEELIGADAVARVPDAATALGAFSLLYMTVLQSGYFQDEASGAAWRPA